MLTLKRTSLSLAAGLALAALGTATLAAPTFSLSKTGLQWAGEPGTPPARLAVRGKQLDQRPALGSTPALVVLLDSDQAQPLLVQAPAGASTKLQPWTALPVLNFNVEALCLYRDAQALTHLFAIGSNGLTEQWLLSEQGHRLLRRLALPAGSEHCQADDANGQLYVSQPGLGVWRYAIAEEGAPTGVPVSLRKPWGRLAFAPGALKLQGGQLTVSEDDGPRQARYPLAGAALSSLPVVQPRAQTAPVARFGDAADDPAIWVHPKDGQFSRVLGTNKKQGLLVYDLAGRELQSLNVGRLNNVDLRQQVRAGSQRRDVAVSTHRDEQALALFDIDAQGQVSALGNVPTGLKDIYGVCAARSAAGDLEAFVNDKDGLVLHLHLAPAAADGSGPWQATELRRWKMASQPEGCVVDEVAGRLFLGEEDRGVWVVDAAADRPAQPRLILPVGGILQADTEGLALWHGREAGKPHSYLVVSSQGNSSYVVLDAAPPWRVRGAFRVGVNPAAGIDGSSETDGLEVSSAAFGPDYPEGLLVVQDGHKHLPDGPQNFKLIGWREVAQALGLKP